MAHDHDHAHGAHSHTPSAGADRRWLAIALALILGFMALEVVAGLLAGSLALLSDAAHMLTDAASLALALLAARLAARPPTGRFTFGLGRAEILSAQVNGAVLLVLAGVIGFDAVRRLADSLNVEGARSHILTDLYASLGAASAGALVLLFGFREADPIAALVVAALMLRTAWSLLRESGLVLLEGTPRDLDSDAVGRALAGHAGVVEVHDLHVWEVTSGFPALAAHVLVAAGDDCHGIRHALESLLDDRFGIHHTTLQVEHEHEDAGQLLEIEGSEDSVERRGERGGRQLRQ